MEKVKVGSKVLICSNPRKSVDQYGGSTVKLEKLANTVAEVKITSLNGNIRILYRGSYYTFVKDEYKVLPENLKPVSIKKLFDINNLFLEEVNSNETRN